MSKDSSLKKEFKPSEVQRMRNLITGKSGDRTQIQAGYEKSQNQKKEGDTWEENGKTWTIKDGIKQNITKFDTLKKMVVLPILCPKCKKLMKINDLNKKMYSIHSMCFDCVIEYEDALKRVGQWEEYAETIYKNNRETYIEDVEKALEAWYNENESYISEQGDVQSWVGGNKKDMYDQIKAQLNKIKSEQQ